jgi:PAS domain S-box-containing protein
VILANPATLAVFGMTPDAFIGKTADQVLPDKDIAASLIAGEPRIMETGLGGVFEETFPTPHGVRTFLVAKQPFRDSENRVIGLIGIARDITERKLAEAEVRRHEERLRLTMEAAGMITWDLDVATGILRYSDNLKTLVGGDDTDRYCSVASIMQEIHPDDRQSLAASLEQVLAGRETFEMEYRARMLDGAYRWILGRGRLARDAAGNPRVVLGVSTDITDRKRAHEMVQESERKFRLIAENTTDVIFAFDMDRKPLYANPAVKNLTGYDFSEIQQRGFINWIHPQDQHRMLKLWEELYQGRDVSP